MTRYVDDPRYYANRADEMAEEMRAKPSPSRDGGTPRNDQVICPGCCHQFYAICVDDQKHRSQLERELAELREALEFYANMDSWLPPRIGGVTAGCPRSGTAPAFLDRGKVARAALAGRPEAGRQDELGGRQEE